MINIGSGMLNISSIVANANFGQWNTCGTNLAAGAHCTINVAFKPHTKIGPITGTITITDDASNSPQTVSLSGVGTWETLQPSSLDFGSQPVGTTSQPQTVTLTNHAKVALSVIGVRLRGPNPGFFAQTNTCGTSVPAGGSCSISVTFAPKYKGARTATLQVGDNGGGSPQTVTVSGTGT